jgi:hypothetical protein
MNFKIHLTYFLIALGIVMFSNQAVYAQKETAAVFQGDSETIFPEKPAHNLIRDNLYFALITNHFNYNPLLDSRDEKSELIEMNRKYCLNDFEINRAAPVAINSYFNYCTIPIDSTKHSHTKEFYLNKSKNQKTAGWVCLGMGTTMIIVGSVGFANNYDKTSTDLASDVNTVLNASFFTLIFTAGVLCDIVSIPLFASAHHNKKLAATLSFDNQHIYSPLNKSLSRNVYPSLTVKIRL